VPRLLLVEDDPSIAEPLVAALRREGHDVVWSSTGADGLAAAGPEVDLVLLDLGLPDIDGLEVARRLRSRQGRRVSARRSIAFLAPSELTEKKSN